MPIYGIFVNIFHLGWLWPGTFDGLKIDIGIIHAKIWDMVLATLDRLVPFQEVLVPYPLLPESVFFAFWRRHTILQTEISKLSKDR